MKTALVTGITGQDGAYLAKQLLERGYRVIGGVRRSSALNRWRLIDLGIDEAVELVSLELMEPSNIRDVLRTSRPDEIYNLAAQSFVAESFRQPFYTSEVDAMGALRLLEAMRECAPEARFYQASTSEMFGKVRESPQTETTPFYPRSPYGVAKVFAHWMTVNYREAHGLFCCSGILFNHESPLRGAEFLTRKVTLGLAKVAAGVKENLVLGNMDSRRDWGFAPEYVDGMWRMLQQDKPGDFVLATGKATTVREFVALAAAAAGFDLRWEGQGLAEKGIDTGSGRTIVEISSALYRPAEVDLLLGDAGKAADALDWRPSTGLSAIVEKMVEADLARVRSGHPAGI